jgi:hypothetical protein
LFPPTGKYIREDRCQTPIERFSTIALRPPIDLLYMGGTLEKAGVECRLGTIPRKSWTGRLSKAIFGNSPPDLLIHEHYDPLPGEGYGGVPDAKSIKPECLTIAKGAHFNLNDRSAWKRTLSWIWYSGRIRDGGR